MLARWCIPRQGYGISFSGLPAPADITYTHTHARTAVPSRNTRTSRTVPARVVAVLVVFAVAFYLFSGLLADTPAPGSPSTVAATATPTPAPAPVVPDASQSATTAQTLAALAAIPVKGRSPKTGYDREGQFGRPWTDEDHNGCDTRNDILARDLAAATLEGACRVVSGTLADPYTGGSIAFERGEQTSALVQIDHVVALSNAWQTGAAQIGPERRVAFANDPLNLLAVDGATNSAKGDGDAATWLPPSTAFRCTYVSRQVAVKSAYSLWVTQAEHDAIARVLATCP